MEIERKYGAAATILFPMIKAGETNFATGSDWTPVAADTQISKDEAAFGNTTNTPSHEGNGMWSLSLTATEMQAARIMITVVDAATKAVEDQAIIISTYGNASAQHELDRDVPRVSADVDAINGSTTAAADLEDLVLNGYDSDDNVVFSNLKQINDDSVVGNVATLTLKQLDIQNSSGTALIAKSTGGNGHGVDIAGNGTGDGMAIAAGATGKGIEISTTAGRGIEVLTNGGGAALYLKGDGSGVAIHAEGGASAHGIYALSGNTGTIHGIFSKSFGGGNGFYGQADSNAAGIKGEGNGTGPGIEAVGGATGNGLKVTGGATSGDGILVTAPGGGHGMNIQASGSAKHGAYFQSGGSGTSHGILAESNNGGAGLRVVGSGPGVEAVGTGSSAGIIATGGATGHGAHFQGGSTSGDGIHSEAQTSGDGIHLVAADNGHGLNAAGSGSGDGANFDGGATGHGIMMQGGSTSGNGLNISAQTLGAGVVVAGAGSGAHGIEVVAGTGTAHGIKVTGGGSGDGLNVSAGATGRGVHVTTTAGHALSLDANGTSKHGIIIRTSADGNGIDIVGGSTGKGMNISGGSTSGNAVDFNTTSGHGLCIDVNGSAKHGIEIGTADGNGIDITAGGSSRDGIAVTGSGTGFGVQINGGATGDGMRIRGGATSGIGLHVQSQAGDDAVHFDAVEGWGLKTLGSPGGIYAGGQNTGDIGIAAMGSAIDPTTYADGQGLLTVTDGGSTGTQGAIEGIAITGGNGRGMLLQGFGSGPGFEIQAGATGIGLTADGGSSSGAGVRFQGDFGGIISGNVATAVGLLIQGNTSGDALQLISSTGNGLDITAGGNGVDITTSGADSDGIISRGAGTGNGMTLIKGGGSRTSDRDIDADEIGGGGGGVNVTSWGGSTEVVDRVKNAWGTILPTDPSGNVDHAVLTTPNYQAPTTEAITIDFTWRSDWDGTGVDPSKMFDGMSVLIEDTVVDSLDGHIATISSIVKDDGGSSSVVDKVRLNLSSPLAEIPDGNVKVTFLPQVSRLLDASTDLTDIKTSLDNIRDILVHSDTTVTGAVTPTTTEFSTGKTDPDDFYNGAIMYGLTGANSGKIVVVTDFANTDGKFTISPAFDSASSSGDTFRILRQFDETALSGLTPTQNDALIDLKNALAKTKFTGDIASNVISDTDLVWNGSFSDGYYAGQSVTIVGGTNDGASATIKSTREDPGNAGFAEVTLNDFDSTGAKLVDGNGLSFILTGQNQMGEFIRYLFDNALTFDNSFKKDISAESRSRTTVVGILKLLEFALTRAQSTNASGDVLEIYKDTISHPTGSAPDIESSITGGSDNDNNAFSQDPDQISKRGRID